MLRLAAEAVRGPGCPRCRNWGPHPPDEQQPLWIPQVAGVLTRVQEALELAGSAVVILGAWRPQSQVASSTCLPGICGKVAMHVTVNTQPFGSPVFCLVPQLEGGWGRAGRLTSWACSPRAQLSQRKTFPEASDLLRIVCRAAGRGFLGIRRT